MPTIPPRTARSKAAPTVDGMTVVKSGLKAGERVVVSGQYRLKPGVKVSAAAAQPASLKPRRNRHYKSRRTHMRQRRRHEHLGAIHQPSRRDHPVDDRACFCRNGGVSAASRGTAAQSRLSHHQHFGVAAGRQPRDHGFGGGAAARASILADRRGDADDLDKHARGHLDRAPVRVEPQYRRGGAGRAIGDRRSG